MSFQTPPFGFGPPAAASSAPLRKEEAKLRRKSTIVVPPVNLTSTPRSPERSPEIKPHHDQQEGSADNKQDTVSRVKSVQQVFGRKHKTSVGGKSLPANLIFTTPPTDHESRKYPRTPRLKEDKAPHSVQAVVVPTTSTIQDLVGDLSHFVVEFEKEVQGIDKAIQVKKKETSDKVGKEEIEVLARQAIVEDLGPRWLLVRQQMDAFFNLQGEENPRLLKNVNLDMLGLTGLLPTSPKVAGKATGMVSLKSVKGEKHLEIAHSFLATLFLDNEYPLDFKINKKKLNQFAPHDKEAKTEGVIFHYIKSLHLLAELLKGYPADLEQLEGSDPHLEIARKFVKQFKNLKEFKELRGLERGRELDLFCNDMAECLLHYAQSLSQTLKDYLKNSPDTTLYLPLLKEGTEENLKSYVATKSCEISFGGDFARALEAKYLTLETDRENIEVPKITKGVRKKEKQEFLKYCEKFLIFFMDHLNIDYSEENDEFNPLTVLKEKESMELLYIALEKEWQNVVRDYGKETPYEGVFKLLPVLRAFSQAILLAPHANIMQVEKFMSGAINHKIIREYPGASSSKLRKEGEKLDRETKSMQIKFDKRSIQIDVTRLGALERLPTPSGSSPAYFKDCSIKACVTLNGAMDDLHQWSVKTKIEVERPFIEATHLEFLERFSALMATLEIMGIDYTVKTI